MKANLCCWQLSPSICEITSVKQHWKTGHVGTMCYSSYWDHLLQPVCSANIWERLQTLYGEKHFERKLANPKSCSSSRTFSEHRCYSLNCKATLHSQHWIYKYSYHAQHCKDCWHSQHCKGSSPVSTLPNTSRRVQYLKNNIPFSHNFGENVSKKM